MKMQGRTALAVALDEAYRTFARRTAVVDVDGMGWTYHRLHEHVTEIGDTMRRAGIARGDRVVLLVPKGVQLLAWQLACIEAGIVLVPLAADSGEAYVRSIVEASGAVARVTPDLELVRLDTADPGIGVPPDATALMFTSGSTGEPKGVLVTAGAILNLATWGRAEFSVGTGDVLAAVAPLHFAASTFDVFTGLLSGARLWLVPERVILRPDELLRLAVESGVTIWTSVSSVAMLLTRARDVGEGFVQWRSLRLLVFSGERMPVAVARTLRAVTSARLVQFYGTTETNVCAFHDLPATLPDSLSVVPVGRACAGHEIVLGPRGEDGAAEISVAGPGVMHGYWGAEPYVAGSFHVTGDRGYLDEHGDLVLQGRTDDVVKIRGRRVDLGAVESAVASLDGVLGAVALRRGEGIDGRLVLMVELEDGTGRSHITRRCAEVLPSHLRPDSVLVRALPRTPRGKVDRAALRAEPDVPQGDARG